VFETPIVWPQLDADNTKMEMCSENLCYYHLERRTFFLSLDFQRSFPGNVWDIFNTHHCYLTSAQSKLHASHFVYIKLWTLFLILANPKLWFCYSEAAIVGVQLCNGRRIKWEYDNWRRFNRFLLLLTMVFPLCPICLLTALTTLHRVLHYCLIMVTDGPHKQTILNISVFKTCFTKSFIKTEL